jgi:hypothetical protein
MASNEPTGDNRRIGAVRKRSQRKGKLMGKTAWTKRSRESGRFMDVKKSKKSASSRLRGALRPQGRREVTRWAAPSQGSCQRRSLRPPSPGALGTADILRLPPPSRPCPRSNTPGG